MLYMELNDTVVTSIKERRKPKFITSLAIVSEVMGVPMAAVESIARQNNIEIITKDRGACIDEDALCGVYADAYVRKIKCYFNNCTRHLYELNNAEQLQFYQFCTNTKRLPFSALSANGKKLTNNLSALTLSRK